MSRIIIESTNKTDTPADIEDKLEKAMSSIQLQRDKREFSDIYLKELDDRMSQVTQKIFDNMIEEVTKVLNE